MESAITYINHRSVSYVATIEELLKEINHYQAHWLTSTGGYANRENTIVIKVNGLTHCDRKWLSARMK